MKYYLKDIPTTLKELKTKTSGLSFVEAEKRLKENGLNELKETPKKSLFQSFIEQLTNPMIVVLIIAAVVSIAIGFFSEDSYHDYIEASIILIVVMVNSILGVFQESKAERAIEALKKMNAATAKVRRENRVLTIPAKEIVIGDIILLEAGDIIPADMRLTVSASLQIEEATLTGESIPVEKQIEVLKEEKDRKISLGDRINMAYLGSTVIYGRGEGIACACGMESEMGKIADMMQNVQEGETPLQKRLEVLSKNLSIIVLVICAIIFVASLLTTSENETSYIESFLIAISLAVAAIPEGLAAVVTIILSLGVTNMAKKGAIIRKLSAVETLGNAQVICSDKTGTLTQNKMSVIEYYGDLDELIKALVLCNDSKISFEGDIIGDPTENALIDFALSQGINANDLNKEYPRVNEVPFDSKRKMMTTINKTKKGFVQYTKGALDEVLNISTHTLVKGKVVKLDNKQKDTILKNNFQQTKKGLRVLACSYKILDILPKESKSKELEQDMIFIGLVAMSDPIRLEVFQAVNSCKSAGIKVVMITGDHLDTAVTIATELGLIKDKQEAMTGQELDLLNDSEFSECFENIFVYARVQPDHKVRIVNMWKENGFVTAMTGDGANDAPAIKLGDIGVGMGITGTDVTKNVADMVLVDDNFATIVSAVEEGRRIYDNIKKTIQFLLSSNTSEVIAVFLASLSGFILFKPVHLLFINLITDSVPAIALGVEAAQPDIMSRPPIDKKDGIFSKGVIFDVIYQGLLISLLTLTAYFIIDINHNHEYAMTAAFLTMSMCEIFHAYNMRSQKQSIFTLKTHNLILWGAMIISFLLSVLIIYVPVLANAFSLKPLAIKEVLFSMFLAFSIIPLVEIIKFLQRKFKF